MQKVIICSLLFNRQSDKSNHSFYFHEKEANQIRRCEKWSGSCTKMANWRLSSYTGNDSFVGERSSSSQIFPDGHSNADHGRYPSDKRNKTAGEGKCECRLSSSNT